MDLLNSILKNMTSEESVSTLAGKSGADSAKIENLIKSSVPSLLGSMKKNASTEDGAKSLLGALSQHTDTAPIGSQIRNADEVDGSKIIGKILGGGKDDFIRELSTETGLDFTQTSSILSNIAPAIMSSVSAANSEKEPSLKDVFGSLLVDEEDKKILGDNQSGSLLDILKKTIL